MLLGTIFWLEMNQTVFWPNPAHRMLKPSFIAFLLLVVAAAQNAFGERLETSSASSQTSSNSTIICKGTVGAHL
jgi:hypothetical protein